MNIGFFDSGKGAYFIAEYFRKKFPYYTISVLTELKTHQPSIFRGFFGIVQVYEEN